MRALYIAQIHRSLSLSVSLSLPFSVPRKPVLAPPSLSAPLSGSAPAQEGSSSSCVGAMAAQRGHVPRFGEWNQNGQDAAYTTYFETARKGKAAGASIINPNDPEQMADLHRPEPQKPRHGRSGKSSDHIVMNQQPQRTDYGREERREHGGYSPQPRQGNQRPHADSQYRHGGTRRSDGDAGYNNPSAVAQGRAANARHGAPGQGQGRQRPATVPRFGEWDAADPKSSAGYTVIFNQVKEDKKAAAATQFPSPPPVQPAPPAMENQYPHHRRHHHHGSFWGGMFACLRPSPRY